MINITNLKVEKLADRDLFRLTDAFSVSRIPELAASGIYSDLSGSPYYFYMDATDPNNVKVVNEVCQLGIVHNEYGAMSVGNDFNIQGGEEYQHGTYNRAEGTIRIGVLICYADSQQLFVTPFNSTLYLNPRNARKQCFDRKFQERPCRNSLVSQDPRKQRHRPFFRPVFCYLAKRLYICTPRNGITIKF